MPRPARAPQVIRGWFGERRAEFEGMARRAKAIAKPHALFDICRDLNTLVRPQNCVVVVAGLCVAAGASACLYAIRHAA